MGVQCSLCQQYYELGHIGSSFTAMKLANHHIFMSNRNVVAKFWLQPVALASSTRFAAHELNKLARLVEENRKHFLEVWNEYFSH